MAEVSFAQSNIVGKDRSKMVESMPEYPGGFSMMNSFINKNLVYPKEAAKKKVVGQAIVRFSVDSSGKIKDVIIRQTSGNKLLDDEAIRIVMLMPNWKPASQNGKVVSVFFNLPIRFDIDNKLAAYKKAQTELANKYYNEGVKFFEEKNYSMAKEKFVNAISLNCYDTDSKYNLGTTYFKLNQKDSACIVWNELKFSFEENDKKEAELLIKKYCTN